MQKVDFENQIKRLEAINEKSSQKRKAGLIRHTHIYHEAREKFGLSIHEYCVAATIRSYEGGKDSRENMGWVFASKETLAQCLSLGKRTVERAVNELLKNKLIERHSVTKYLRTTEKWIKEIDYWKENSKKKD